MCVFWDQPEHKTVQGRFQQRKGTLCMVGVMSMFFPCFMFGEKYHCVMKYHVSPDMTQHFWLMNSYEIYQHFL